MYLYLPLLFVFLICSSPATAAESARALAKKFVVLLRYDEQFEQFHELCLAQQRSISPEALVAQTPDYFAGVRPGHPKWDEVKVAFGKYFEEMCSRPTREEFLQALSSAYAHALTAEQLQQSLRFYSSKTGSSLITAHRQATGAVYEAWTKTNSRYAVDVHTKFLREIAEIVSGK